MQRRILITLCLLAACFMPRTSFAQTVMMRVAGEDSANVFLEQLDVDVKVTGAIATTTWTMIFRNKATRILEGELTFPLAEGVTISRYAIDINGRLREAVPVDKARGTTVLEAIENRRVDPGLLERVEGNAFRTRVYPLPVGGTRTVLIAYEQPLDQSNPGYLRYRLPLIFGVSVPTVNISATVYQSTSGPVMEANNATDLAFDQQGNAWLARKQLHNFKAAQPLSFRIPQDKQSASIIMQREDNLYYGLLQAPPRRGERTRTLPDRISIVWDASLSGMNRNHEAELALLDAYFKRVRNATVSLVTFSNTVQSARSFNIASGKWASLKKALDEVVYDGGTQLSAIDFSRLGGQEILLFSDGISTYGSDEPRTARVPVWCITSSLRSDYPWLRYFARRSGGGLIDLDALTANDALQQLVSRPLQFLGIKAGGNIRDVYPNAPVPASAGATIAFMSSKPVGEVTLQYGYGRRVTAEQTVHLDATRQAARNVPLARIWAEQKIAALDMRYEQNKPVIEALGKRYGLITRNTSLIVLETVQDYIRYHIAPPQELRSEYNALMKEREEDRQESAKSRLEDMEDAAEALRNWWSGDFKKKPLPKPAKVVVAPPPPAPKPRIPGIGGISGFVENTRGQRITGANVRVFENGNYLGMQNVTDVDGHFSIRPLAAGVYYLIISFLETRAISHNITVRQDTVTTTTEQLHTIEDSAMRAVRFTAGSIPGGPGIRGTLKDEKGNPIVNANVQVMQGGIVKGRDLTDFDGNYTVKPLNRGKYDVTFAYLGKDRTFTNVYVTSDRLTIVNGKLSFSNELKGTTVTTSRYTAPIINYENPGSSSTKTAMEIEHAPIRRIPSATVPTVTYSFSSPRSLSGARSDAAKYVIDGVQLSPGSSTTTSQMQLVSGDFTYDTAMLGNLRQLRPAEQYARYLELRKEKMQVPTFYFAVAGHFIATHRKEIGLRILSNLAELDMENYELYKMLGYKLKEIGEYKAEIDVFRKVLAWRPMDPQSLRDYGLALADAGRYQAALDTLYAAMANDMDESLETDFEGIEETLLPEINNLIALHKDALHTKAIPKKLIVPTPADIRVVINWNMKNTDIDLWVTDPNDEKCFYSNSTTAIGGRITNDFTGGFGPEQFMLRRAIPGKYKIEVNYYGEDQVKIAGAATLMAEVYTGWGTPQQKRQIIVLQMNATDNGGVYIGEFTFGGKK